MSQGQALLKEHRYEEALAAFDRAIQLNPMEPLFSGNKAEFLWKMGRRKESWQEWRRFWRRFPVENPADAPQHIPWCIKLWAFGKSSWVLTRSRRRDKV
ncbi:MAG TPA: tetratricopeptide repeat protein [Ktedonobacterales bacterium]